MNGYYTLGIVGYQREGILDTEKALTAAVGYLVVFGEMMLQAQLMPIVLLILWQYEDDFYIPIFPEPHNGAHQDGQTAHLNELLGHIRPHAQAFASA